MATDAGRSRQRRRQALASAGASVGARAVATLTVLVSVPLTLNYLGAERYGLWMTISSVVSMLAFADFGLGNGLLNAVADANGRDDETAAATCVSTAVLLLAGIALLGSLVFGACYSFVEWGDVFNVSGPTARAEAGPAVATLAACFGASLVLGVVGRVQMGYQEGYLTSLWETAGNLLSLAALLLVVYRGAGLPWLVGVLMGVPLATTALNGGVLFAIQRPGLRPRTALFNGAVARRLLRVGGLFFILQLTYAATFASDNFVIARVLSPEDVARYSVVMRMFAVPTMLLTLAVQPLWPAYGEALARSDVAWMRRALLRSLAVSLAGGVVVAAVLVPLGPSILKIWLGRSIAVPLSLYFGCGLWAIFVASGNAVAMYLNGVCVVGFQVIVSLLVAGSALLAKVWLARQIGVSGVVWGTVAAYFLFAAVPYAVFVPRHLARLGSGADDA